MSGDLHNIPIITGPYRATRLWNAAVRAFHAGMPLSRHRRGLKVYDNCFSGSEAVAWLHHHLCHNPNFSNSVSRDQTIALLKKFVRCGLLEDAVNGESGYSLQFRERGLYRFGSISPVKALRTPGRSSCSDLRASTRRLRASQDSFASPPLVDNKVSRTERSSRSNETKLLPDFGRGAEKCPSPAPKCELNDSDHVSKALNVLGVSKTTYKQFKECDKENFVVGQSKPKVGKSKASFKVAPKRLALRTIENTSSRPERNINAALMNNRKTPANVYVPLSEVRKNFCSHDLDSQKMPSLKENGGSKVQNGKSSENEATHNAINALTEVSNEFHKSEELPKAAVLTNGESGAEPAPSMRSRAKSFLSRPSASSKYSSLIPKFGEPAKHGNSVYASSKTISPKLLHSVSSNPSVKMSSSTAKLTALQASNAHEGSSMNSKEKIDGTIIPQNLDAIKMIKENFLGKKDSDMQPCGVENLVGTDKKSHVDCGQSVLQETMQTKELAKTTGISPKVEQRAFVEAWLEMMDELMYGCPLTLPRLLVHGEVVQHNQQRVSRRGVVLLSPGHPDDLPAWVLAAMRFLAHWPASSGSSEEGCGVPNYPGVELDVYRMVKDYFTHQPSPVIPAPLATALLEIITAMEFLDISFRDPRDRFSLQRRGKIHSSRDVENDGLDLHTPTSWENETNNPLESDSRLSEGTVSVFATLPRGTGAKCKKKVGEIIEALEKQDSVEDLMLNMSIGRVDEQMEGSGTSAHFGNTLNTETGPRFLNASYDRACNHSPLSQPPAPCVQPTTEPVWCSQRDTEALLQPSFGSCPSEGGFKLKKSSEKEDFGSKNSDLSRAKSTGLSKSEVAGSRHSSLSPAGGIHGDLQALSSTNISHIERFTPKEDGAVYVSGDDVRRRKNKRRFFSKAGKKNDESSSNRNVDLRRFSIYESIHCVSDDDTVAKDVYSSLEDAKRSRSSGFLGSRKRSYSTRLKAESPEQNTPSGESRDVDIVRFSGKKEGSSRNTDLKYQTSTNFDSGKFSSLPQEDLIVNPVEIDTAHLPPNSCFETAFTSDSPRTRIIPQKSVDTLHLGQLKRRRRGFTDSSMTRPKSIAVLPGDNQYGEFIPQSLQRRNLMLGSISCDNSPLYAAHNLRSENCSPKASSMSNVQGNHLPQMESEFKAPPPPPVKKYSAGSHEASFSKSQSTGDLNAAQDWLLDGQLQHYDSRGESRLSVDTERSGCSVTTIADGRSSGGPSKSRSLVHKVRDSLRRKKAKMKENARYKKANLQDPASSARSSTQGTPACSPTGSTANGDPNVRGHVGEFGRHDVHFARVVSSEHGHAMHQQNVDTLRRLRSNSGGISVPTPLVHRTKSGGFVNLGLLTPSTDEIMSVSSSRDSALPRSACSPFTASSAGDLSDTHSMASASLAGYMPAEQATGHIDGSHEALPEETCAYADVPALSPFTGWSSVTTTNYCTNLSTHYASNHHLMMAGGGCRDASSPFEGRARSDSARSSEVQSLASTPLPQPLSSRSNSLSSLYTTALTCYDESDPHPFTATQLHGSTPPPPHASLKGGEGISAQRDHWLQEDSDSAVLESQFCSSVDLKPAQPYEEVVLSGDDRSSLNYDTSCGCEESAGYVTSRRGSARLKQTSHALEGPMNVAAKIPSSQIASNCNTETAASSHKIHESTSDAAQDDNNVLLESRKVVSRDPAWQESPRVYTPEGIDRLQVCVQLLLLLLQPVARRRLHLLLRLLHKMSNNDHLHLGSSAAAGTGCVQGASTRQVVLDDLSWCVVRGGDGRWRRLITLLVDHHHTLLAPSSRLARAVQLRLSQLSVPRSTTTTSPLVLPSYGSSTSLKGRAPVLQRDCDDHEGHRNVTFSKAPVIQHNRDGHKDHSHVMFSASVENVGYAASNASKANLQNESAGVIPAPQKHSDVDGSFPEKNDSFAYLVDGNHGSVVGKKFKVGKVTDCESECKIRREVCTNSHPFCNASRSAAVKSSGDYYGTACVGSASRVPDDKKSLTSHHGDASGCCHSNTSCNSHGHNIGGQCVGPDKSYNSHCHYECHSHNECHSGDRFSTKRFDESDNANNANAVRLANENDILRVANALIRYESNRLLADNCADKVPECCRSRIGNPATFLGNKSRCFQYPDPDHERESACIGSGPRAKNFSPQTECHSRVSSVSSHAGNRLMTHKEDSFHRRFADKMQVDLDEGFIEFPCRNKRSSNSCGCAVNRDTLSFSGPRDGNVSSMPRSCDGVEVGRESKRSARDAVDVGRESRRSRNGVDVSDGNVHSMPRSRVRDGVDVSRESKRSARDGVDVGRERRSARAASYCVQVGAAEWQRQRTQEGQEHHLLQLLCQIVTDDKLSLDAKKTKISQFAGLYPKIYEENTATVPEELRPSACERSKKKSSGSVLKGMMRLASWSHLSRQRSSARL